MHRRRAWRRARWRWCWRGRSPTPSGTSSPSADRRCGSRHGLPARFDDDRSLSLACRGVSVLPRLGPVLPVAASALVSGARQHAVSLRPRLIPRRRGVGRDCRGGWRPGVVIMRVEDLPVLRGRPGHPVAAAPPQPRLAWPELPFRKGERTRLLVVEGTGVRAGQVGRFV